ncbi:MAG: glycosyltransferase [Pirellulales bacterium]|nr:glycosyltransferase [Pirellulales bacterium]
MKVALVTGSISRSGAGVAAAVRDLTEALAAAGDVELSVASLEDEHAPADLAGWSAVRPRLSPVVGPPRLGYAPRLRESLLEIAPDLVHTHGLWQLLSASVSAWERATRKPYLVSPHGMIDPWALRLSRWKKRLALALYENRHLRRAACLHALCDAERDSARAMGLCNPVAVIPNGVNLPAAPAPLADGPRQLLFLGRLHPKKGLSELLAGWTSLSATERREWRLVVAGADDAGMLPGLRRQAADAGIADSVDLVGPKYGRDKHELICASSAFVLPSHSEGLPVAALEASSYGLPLLITDHCNLPEMFAAEAAVRIEPRPESIAAGLRTLASMSTADLRSTGARGRRLVEERFAWPRIAVQFVAAYQWVLGGGPPPEFVCTD